MKKFSTVTAVCFCFLLGAGNVIASETVNATVGSSVANQVLVDAGVRSNAENNISVGGVSPGLPLEAAMGSFTPYTPATKDASNTASGRLLHFAIPRVLGSVEFANFYANLAPEYKELIKTVRTAPTKFSSPDDVRGGKIGWYTAQETFSFTEKHLLKRGLLNVSAVDGSVPREHAIVLAMDQARRPDRDIVVVFFADTEKIVVGKEVDGWKAGAGMGTTLIGGTSFFAPSIGIGYSNTDEKLSQDVLAGTVAAVYEVVDREAFNALVEANRLRAAALVNNSARLNKPKK